MTVFCGNAYSKTVLECISSSKTITKYTIEGGKMCQVDGDGCYIEYTEYKKTDDKIIFRSTKREGDPITKPFVENHLDRYTLRLSSKGYKTNNYRYKLGQLDYKCESKKQIL
jgi:hypothetical protein